MKFGTYVVFGSTPSLVSEEVLAPCSATVHEPHHLHVSDQYVVGASFHCNVCKKILLLLQHRFASDSQDVISG